MSNTIINWRFWAYHFQVVRPGDWRAYWRDGRWPISWSRNRFHDKGGPGRRISGWSPIALYEGAWLIVVPIAIVALAVWGLAR